MLGGYIEKTEFFEEAAIRFGNEFIEAILVPGLGSQILALKWKKTGTDILRSPKTIEEYSENPFLFGDPILFPPNRIEAGRFTFRELAYQFVINEKENHNHIHGLLHDKPWKRGNLEVAEDRIIVRTNISSDDFPEILKQFPHSFTVEMTYIIQGSTLRKEARIENHGTKAFPWGFGYHTTFQFSEKSRISLPIDRHWELDERMLPTGKVEHVTEAADYQKGISLAGKKFDDVFGKADKVPNQAVLHDGSGNYEIHYRCDDYFGQWVLYNDAGFVCPEPYTWVTNAPNLDLPADQTGIRVLQPGKSVKLHSSIELKEMK